jgi:hypothetical protein
VSAFTTPNPFAFTEDEADNVQALLESLVMALRHVPGGGKIEEGYWSFIYHGVRGAEVPGWSNLPMRDFTHKGLGVEMKVKKERRPLSLQGKRIMHPAATRTISFDPAKGPEACKTQVLHQFGAQISQFRDRVREVSEGVEPELRWGVLLWSPRLDEFLYFEEAMIEPKPDEYVAEFVERRGRGGTTRNLHIFERATGVKRFSVTSPEKGAKVQPYFDVPRVGEGAYSFTIPDDERKPLWLSENTITRLQELAGDQDVEAFLRDRFGI